MDPPVYLADEPGHEQQHQDAVVVSTVTKEGLGHEGGEERNVSVGLTHLHLPQLHLDGLNTEEKGEREHSGGETFRLNQSLPLKAVPVLTLA